MGTESRANSEGRPLLPWLWALSAFFLAVALSEWLPQGYRASGAGVPFLLFLGLACTIEGLLMFWVARRTDLGPQLIRSLRMTGCAFALTALTKFWWIPGECGIGPEIPRALSAKAMFLTYVLGLLGILMMPARRTHRSMWWEFALDLSTAVLGMSVVLGLVFTLPQFSANADPSIRASALTYGGAQTLMLVGLNVLVLRGTPQPSRRAFWLFVCMVVFNLLTVLIVQFETARGPVPSYRFSALASCCTSLTIMWMAAAFRYDPIDPVRHSPGPSWFSTFNPLPLLATAGVAGLLLYAVFTPGSWSVRLLASVMVLQTALLLARLFLTSHENARLQREEVAHDKQRQEEKVVAIRRLAGGMAHWYNNLLTAVMGRAELGAIAAIDPALKEGFAVILAAADRAGRLTNQLLSYVGGSRGLGSNGTGM